ncbi:MAG: patatin-like phospholipase family protein [Candidatus Sungbacteria bacterium]|nr:patatin-like phospholipase family protein [Candidatus Sungbacteria bacterium]
MFDLMRASSSMPLAHPPVVLGGISYIDGGLSDTLPFQKALADGYDEVVVVYNKPSGFLAGERYDTFCDMLALGLPKQTSYLVRHLKFHYQEIQKVLEQEPRLKVIRPKVQLPLKSILDTNKARLNACVDMGIADAKEFLRTYHQERTSVFSNPHMSLK